MCKQALPLRQLRRRGGRSDASIVVLPLVNLSVDLLNDYFSAGGLTEELITALVVD
jgi:TolB-like protein